jgi:hypothetical protein
MIDDLELLKQLPRHAPSEEHRRDVRVLALQQLEQQQLAQGEPAPWWQIVWQQVAIPLALAAFSAVYLARAAADTPLFR